MADTMREKLIELQKECEETCKPSSACVTCIYRTQADCMERLTADIMIANGVTVQQWIPITERLPELDVDVLAFNGDYIFVSKYFRSHWGSWDKVGHLVWVKDSYAKNPTHWMPLPEPPKGE